MYEQHLQYVKDYLLQSGGFYPPDPQYNFRSKYEHTLRVLHWCKRQVLFHKFRQLIFHKKRQLFFHTHLVFDTHGLLRGLFF